jgi:hypothetical protein
MVATSRKMHLAESTILSLIDSSSMALIQLAATTAIPAQPLTLLDDFRPHIESIRDLGTRREINSNEEEVRGPQATKRVETTQ